jgi:hypothetical protein
MCPGPVVDVVEEVIGEIAVAYLQGDKLARTLQ